MPINSVQYSNHYDAPLQNPNYTKLNGIKSTVLKVAGLLNVKRDSNTFIRRVVS
jgi:hypothetical protein